MNIFRSITLTLKKSIIIFSNGYFIHLMFVFSVLRDLSNPNTNKFLSYIVTQCVKLNLYIRNLDILSLLSNVSVWKLKKKMLFTSLSFWPTNQATMKVVEN